jgi:hypothetical protein
MRKGPHRLTILPPELLLEFENYFQNFCSQSHEEQMGKMACIIEETRKLNRLD